MHLTEMHSDIMINIFSRMHFLNNWKIIKAVCSEWHWNSKQNTVFENCRVRSAEEMQNVHMFAFVRSIHIDMMTEQWKNAHSASNQFTNVFCQLNQLKCLARVTVKRRLEVNKAFMQNRKRLILFRASKVKDAIQRCLPMHMCMCDLHVETNWEASPSGDVVVYSCVIMSKQFT